MGDKGRDPRFVTLRRGGFLEDETHRRLALWAADCAEHVLGLFERECPGDERPRNAVATARAWARGEVSMIQARRAAYAAHDAAKGAAGAAVLAARAAGHAAATAHMADHELGAAAYAIKAARAASPEAEREKAGEDEADWQRRRLPAEIRELVLSDQGNRNEKFRFLFRGRPGRE